MIRILLVLIAGLAFCLASPLNMLSYFLTGNWQHVVQADKALAGRFCGWGYTHTVSAWCGSVQYGGCVFCKAVRWALDSTWPGHTHDHAINEGLIPLEAA